ncbi:head-tail joining protein [Acinetobacter beijerinckii]|uniref:head-tail joining protein n=1 Tax=Acinetobacter beijerinckii TaxID=262668 RepID=UPI0030D9E27B
MSVDWQSKVLSPLMAAFGQPITYYSVKDKYNVKYQLTGIFDQAYTDINIVDGIHVTSVSPCIGLNLANLPVTPSQKDQILVKAAFGAPLEDTFYIVKKVMPDGHGGCRLLLNVAPKPCDITSGDGTQDQ